MEVCNGSVQRKCAMKCAMMTTVLLMVITFKAESTFSVLQLCVGSNAPFEPQEYSLSLKVPFRKG